MRLPQHARLRVGAVEAAGREADVAVVVGSAGKSTTEAVEAAREGDSTALGRPRRGKTGESSVREEDEDGEGLRGKWKMKVVQSWRRKALDGLQLGSSGDQARAKEPFRVIPQRRTAMGLLLLPPAATRGRT